MHETQRVGYLLGAGRRPSQGAASVFCYLCFLLFVFCYLCFLCSEFPELCSVTKPKLGLRLGTKVKICCTIDSRWRSSGVGRY